MYKGIYPEIQRVLILVIRTLCIWLPDKRPHFLRRPSVDNLAVCFVIRATLSNKPTQKVNEGSRFVRAARWSIEGTVKTSTTRCQPRALCTWPDTPPVWNWSRATRVSTFQMRQKTCLCHNSNSARADASSCTDTLLMLKFPRGGNRLCCCKQHVVTTSWGGGERQRTCSCSASNTPSSHDHILYYSSMTAVLLE